MSLPDERQDPALQKIPGPPPSLKAYGFLADLRQKARIPGELPNRVTLSKYDVSHDIDLLKAHGKEARDELWVLATEPEEIAREALPGMDTVEAAMLPKYIVLNSNGGLWFCHTEEKRDRALREWRRRKDVTTRVYTLSDLLDGESGTCVLHS